MKKLFLILAWLPSIVFAQTVQRDNLVAYPSSIGSPQHYQALLSLRSVMSSEQCDACEVMQCLASGGDQAGGQCQAVLDKYYSIKGGTDAETMDLRGRFVNNCPQSDQQIRELEQAAYNAERLKQGQAQARDLHPALGALRMSNCRQTGENTFACEGPPDNPGPKVVTIPEMLTSAARNERDVVTGSLSFDLPDTQVQRNGPDSNVIYPSSFDGTGEWYKQILSQYGDLLQGVARMACEALLCMGGGGGEACQPSLDMYYSIQGNTDAETKQKRLEFLNQCPT